MKKKIVNKKVCEKSATDALKHRQSADLQTKKCRRKKSNRNPGVENEDINGYQSVENVVPSPQLSHSSQIKRSKEKVVVLNEKKVFKNRKSVPKCKILKRKLPDVETASKKGPTSKSKKSGRALDYCVVCNEDYSRPGEVIIFLFY